MPVSIDDQKRQDAVETVHADGSPKPNPGFSSADPPKAPAGLSSTLQPGGTTPGGGPGAGVGSIGTGGGQNRDEPTGSLKRGGR